MQKWVPGLLRQSVLTDGGGKACGGCNMPVSPDATSEGSRYGIRYRSTTDSHDSSGWHQKSLPRRRIISTR